MNSRVLIALVGLCSSCALLLAEQAPLIGEPDAVGLIVLSLEISSIEHTYESGFVVTAHAEHEGKSVGIELELPATWQLTPANPEQGVPHDLYVGTAKFRSQGQPTESLVSAMAGAFGEKPPRFRMAEVNVTVVALGTNPDDRETKPLQLQFIHGVPGERSGEDAPEYVEWFCVLDCPHRLLCFHEIDRKYRAALVGLLSRQETIRPVAAANWMLPRMPRDLLAVPDTANLRKCQLPLFPDAERRSGIPGEVLVKLTLTDDGAVASWRILRASSPGFAGAVEKAFKRKNTIGNVPAGTRVVSFVFVGLNANRPDRPGTIWLVSSSFGELR